MYPEHLIRNEQVDSLFARLQPFVGDLALRGFNIGVDSYFAVYRLLLALDTFGELSDDILKLRTLLAPIVCGSEQEQLEFERQFYSWFGVADQQPATTSTVAEIGNEIKNEKKKLIISFLLWGMLLIGFIALAAWLIPKFSDHPEPTKAAQPLTSEKVQLNPQSAPQPASQPASASVVAPSTPASPAINWAQLAFLSALALFALTLLWYVFRHLHVQRFLKRHGASEPPELIRFFQNNPLSPFSSLAFARAAQQLHKHRDLDAQLLDVEATVKRTIEAGGIYTPEYKAIKALPEYLVLIDRASYNDQLSQFVDALIKELEDFNLFIERYYFDRDPRRCYAARAPSQAWRLEALQNRCPNHRLIIFCDSRHFIDPLSGVTYPWLNCFHEWQQPFLFSPEAPWSADKQQLQDAGFIVLATGQQGMETLVDHVASDMTVALEDAQGIEDNFPLLIRQRPRRFLERQNPDTGINARLMQQLNDYLGKDGLNWLAACAVYPELHWQLTLYLGLGFGKEATGIDEALLLKMVRLPWLRYGYMPDWLRLSLLDKLDSEVEQAIRRQLEKLLASMITQGSGQDFTLDIAQASPAANWLRDVMRVWGKSNSRHFRDQVFQSFMAGRLAVKATLPLVNRKIDRRYALLAGELILVGVAAWWLAIASTIPHAPQHTVPKHTVAGTMELEMVNISAGSFVMGCKSGRDSDCDTDENPAHTVMISAFQIGKTEVTQGQWKAVMGSYPPELRFKECGDNCPVERVSWDDIQVFIQKLNEQTGGGYRLPTEAEWEYACRAGDKQKYCGSDDIDAVAWYGKNSGYKTHPVGVKQANAWGINDMSGNVWEWVADSYHSDYNGAPVDGKEWQGDGTVRVLRGGS